MGLPLPLAGGHAFPAPEGMQKAGRLGIAQAFRDLHDAEVMGAKQLLGQGHAHLVDQGTELGAFRC